MSGQLSSHPFKQVGSSSSSSLPRAPVHLKVALLVGAVMAAAACRKTDLSNFGYFSPHVL